MSVGLRNSTIETFRRRYHKDQVLRLLALAPDGQSLSILRVVEKGFHIGKNTDVQEGAPDYLLTVDTIYTPGLIHEELVGMFMAELYSDKSGQSQRYRAVANAVANIDEWRYVLQLHGAFNDKREII